MDALAIIQNSEGFIELGHQFVDFRLQLRKLPRFVLFLQLLTGPDHGKEQTKVNSLLCSWQRALTGLNLHIVEINKFLHLQSCWIADISLQGFSFCIDVRHNDDVFVGDFPEGLFLFINNLIGCHLHIVISRKSPPLTHVQIIGWFEYFLNRDMYKTLTTQQQKHKDFFYPQQTMGTTIMAIKYDGGVIACADSRTSAGGVYAVDRVADKIDFVHDHIVALRSGLAGQSQQAVHKLRFLIDSHVNEQGKLPHVKTSARMLQKMNYEKGLQTGYIIAGWDPYNGGQVYSVNLGGACLLRDYALGGSGSGFVYGYVDANFRPNMSYEQAKSFCIHTVSLAMKRDGSSGGIIRLSNITERGLEKQYHTYDSLPYKST